jgi:hypothetical protein
VKAVSGLRDAYDLLDWEDPAIQYTLELVLRAAMSPGFLNRAEVGAGAGGGGTGWRWVRGRAVGAKAGVQTVTQNVQRSAAPTQARR